MITRFMDWRYRRTIRKLGLPDLPEVRALADAAWSEGFYAGSGNPRMWLLKAEAKAAVVRYERSRHDCRS